ncbi:GntR family transcriptional regulator [Pseudomonas sp. EL_65y_Pfl1_R32]|uniref:GntR family transcriptional regulator n=1 Tax=Pseudomonas sp. EL_65y_Pfl1_R32 TaxID=3088696 RepID=UPI0030DD8342
MKEPNTLGLEMIEATPLHEIVYQRLTRALMAGQIRPGQKLTSRKIARELGTSDMPVRAALMKLQSLRALAQLPNGSMTLPVMTRQSFSDLMNTRQICEGAATEQATQHLSAAELKSIKKGAMALTQAARNRDIDDYLLRNYEFKFLIYRASHSESLIFLIETLWLQVGPFLREFGSHFDGDLGQILQIDFHEEAVDALERGDALAAAAAIRRDIAEGAAFLLENGQFGG